MIPCVYPPIWQKGAAPGGITWNPLDKGNGVVLSGGNLIASGQSGLNGYLVRTTGSGHSSGKFYFEIVMTTVNAGTNMPQVGIVNGAFSTNTTEFGPGIFGTYSAIQSTPGFAYLNGTTSTATGVTFASGDVANIAVDLTALKIWFGKNGTYVAAGNPSTGVNQFFNITSDTYFPCAFVNTGALVVVATGRFASGSWGFAPPTGFGQW